MGLAQRTNTPELGAAVPRRGNRITKGIGLLILAVWGWRFAGNLPDLPKQVLVVAPHTSNWDFVLGMAALFALGLRVSWMAKHTLFWEPFGTYLRWLGGVAVDRRAAHGTVGEVVSVLKERDQFVLAITPEGTRKKVRRWKRGFYFIAEKAGVPIVPVAFDYGRKVIDIGPPFYPTNGLEADMASIQSFFSDVVGKHREGF